MDRIYLDNAAATQLHPEVLEAMRPYFDGIYGNAHAAHFEGREARAGVENARESISSYISARPEELIFTGSGTGSNCLAINGLYSSVADNKADREFHIITSAIEHPSVLDAYKKLERKGAKVSLVGVDRDGILDLEGLKKVLSEDTTLVSIMYANNEIGTLQPIEEIGKIIRRHRKNKKTKFPYFHTDASQAPLYIDLDVERDGVDLLTIDAQKLHGPKGVGALYIRSGTPINPVCYGGSQERGLWPGTVNSSGVVGFAKAYDLAEERRQDDSLKVRALRDKFVETVKSVLPEVYLNGSAENRLPNNANLSFPGIEGEYIAMALDERGIAVSTKSACLAGGGEGSYVVAALDRGRAKNAVRFTLGRDTTQNDLEKVVEALTEIVLRMRKL